MGAVKHMYGLSFVAIIALSAPASASLSSFINDNIDGTVTSEDSGYYKTQSRGYYTLGSSRIRWGGMGSIHPVNVQAPSIGVGCSGIDMVFGGFSYLNFEYLVDKLKKISSAAPAFAFKMALSVLCKDCDTIITELEKIANAINGLNFDTCQAAQQIGDWAGKKIGNMASDSLKFGGNENWLSSHTTAIENASSTVQGWVANANQFLNGGGEGAKEQLMQGSIVSRASASYGTIFGNGEEWEAITRAMMGDVIGYSQEKPTSDGKKDLDMAVTILQPLMDYSEFINILMEGGDFNGVEVVQADLGRGLKGFPDIQAKAISIPSGGLKQKMEEKIISIVQKIRTSQTLNQTDLNFINAMPVPVYRIINVVSVLGDTGVEKTAEFIALKQTEALIFKMNQEMARYLDAYKIQKEGKVISEEDVSKINALLDIGRQNRDHIHNLMTAKAADFKKQADLVDYYAELEKKIQQKSPIWTSSSFAR